MTREGLGTRELDERDFAGWVEEHLPCCGHTRAAHGIGMYPNYCSCATCHRQRRSYDAYRL